MGHKTQTSTSTSTNESWLMGGGNQDWFQNWLNGQLGQVGQGVPEYDRAQLTDWQKQALDKLASGSGSALGQLGQLQGGFGQLAGQGWDQYQQGMGQLGSLFGQGGAFTTEGMLDNMSKFYDSDLVKSQTSQLGKDIQNTLEGQIQGINQRATGSGGMGSSRAGVAQGVATGKAADALATGTAAIQNAARQQAFSQAMDVGKQQLIGAQSQIQAGSNMLQGGMSNIGNLINNQYGIGSQDIMNQLFAGGVLQGENQANIDINRLNQMIKDNPSLAGMSQLMPFLTAMAGWKTTGTQTNTLKGGGGISGGLGGLIGLTGAAGGLMSGLGAMGFSDKRLKKNIIKIGNVGKLNLYIWQWNEKAHEIGADENPGIGFIAQEVDDIYSDFVVMDDNGYYKIRYADLLAHISNEAAVEHFSTEANKLAEKLFNDEAEKALSISDPDKRQEAICNLVSKFFNQH